MRIIIPALLCVAATAVSAENYGAPITLTGVASVESAIAKAGGDSAVEVVIEGKVAQVCQAKGCWLGLESAAGDVHVTFANDSFFVPQTLVGRIVRAQGRLTKAGTRYVFVATGLDVKTYPKRQ
jgi:hypothetical protein